MPYRIGDWCAVPLDSGGWARGLIARASTDRIAAEIVGYFFGPRLNELPGLAETVGLRPQNALLVTTTTDQGLRSGGWRVVGGAEQFVREDWPMPVFGRCEFEELGGRCWRVYYDEDNPEKWLRDEPTSRDEALALPEDGLGGHQWTEGRLDILLGGTPRPLDGGPRRTASRFFFAFPSKAKVKLAVGALEAQGFQIFDIFQAEKDDWSVIAEKEIGSSHSLDALDGPDGELEVIAQMAGGTYNGYERPT